MEPLTFYKQESVNNLIIKVINNYISAKHSL